MTERRRKGKSELIGRLIYTSPYWITEKKRKKKKEKINLKNNYITVYILFRYIYSDIIII